MHDEAYAWVRAHALDGQLDVLDIGGRNINGSVRDLFPDATYTAMDIRPGDGVDIVADAATWHPGDRLWDVVVCTEVFEHTTDWKLICVTAFTSLRPDGRFIATMAGPGRPEHSAVDGGWRLHPGEYYGNVEPGDLRAVLEACGFTEIEVDQQFGPCDVRCVAVKAVSDGTG